MSKWVGQLLRNRLKSILQGEKNEFIPCSSLFEAADMKIDRFLVKFVLWLREQVE